MTLQTTTIDGHAGALHVGHGRSAGEPVLIDDFEEVVDDLHRVIEHAREEHPDVPVVLIGHSMGGMVAARYAQRYGQELTALVLSGPVLGRWEAAEQLVELDPIPEVPIEPSRAGVRALVPAADRTEDVRGGARHEVFNETDRDRVLAEVARFIDRVLR